MADTNLNMHHRTWFEFETIVDSIAVSNNYLTATLPINSFRVHFTVLGRHFSIVQLLLAFSMQCLDRLFYSKPTQ